MKLHLEATAQRGVVTQITDDFSEGFLVATVLVDPMPQEVK